MKVNGVTLSKSKWYVHPKYSEFLRPTTSDGNWVYVETHLSHRVIRVSAKALVPAQASSAKLKKTKKKAAASKPKTKATPRKAPVKSRKKRVKALPAQSTALVARDINSALKIDFLPDNAGYKHRFHVPSSSSDNLYVVSQNKKTGEWSCGCLGWCIKKPGKERDCGHLKPIRHLLIQIADKTSKRQIKA